MAYDYRAARDRIFGIVREPGSDKVKSVIRTGASTNEIAFQLALVEFAPNIEPSTATLAEMLGTDARCIRRWSKSCQQKGLLKVTPRKSSSNLHATNHYELLCDPGLKVRTDTESVLAVSPSPTDTESGEVRTVSPPKQTSKADKKADKESARSAPRSPKVEVSNSPDHATVTKRYFERFEAVRGVRPPFDARDGKAVNDLLAKCGADGSIKVLDGAFSDPFWRTKVTIRDLALNPAKFIGLTAQVGRGGPKQPNGGAWKAVVE